MFCGSVRSGVQDGPWQRATISSSARRGTSPSSVITPADAVAWRSHGASGELSDRLNTLNENQFGSSRGSPRTRISRRLSTASGWLKIRSRTSTTSPPVASRHAEVIISTYDVPGKTCRPPMRCSASTQCQSGPMVVVKTIRSSSGSRVPSSGQSARTVGAASSSVLDAVGTGVEGAGDGEDAG